MDALSSTASARRRKHERFLPYAYERSGLNARVTGARLDGTDHELPASGRVLEVDADSWTTLAIDLEIDVAQTLLDRILPERERSSAPVDLMMVLRCEPTRLRRRIVLQGAPLTAGVVHSRIDLARDDLRGCVGLTPFLIRRDDAIGRARGYAGKAGARLASGRSWEVLVDRRPEASGRFLDIRYKPFAEDEALRAHEQQLYRLELDTDAPILWINADHPKIADVFEDPGTTGKKARLREVFFDIVAQGVWSQFLLRAAIDLSTRGELTYDWQDVALRELLPLMYPGLRTHPVRLSALMGTLRDDGLPDTVARLDGALQRKNDLTRHMTRLVEDVLEVGKR